VGLSVQVAPGITLATVSYTLTGPNAFRHGIINVSASPTISAFIGGIPAGSGYTILLTGVSSDGSVKCAGASEPFTVQARLTTSVPVSLKCVLAASEAGAVLVGVVPVACPTIDGVSALPITAFVGGNLTVKVAARGPSPAALTYSWSSASGTLTNATSAAATFTCTAAGTFPVTVTVSDGSDAAGCVAVQSVNVTCVVPVDAGPGFTAGTFVPPAPPSTVGCYAYDANPADGSSPQWSSVACLPAQAIASLPHPNIGGITVYGIDGIDGPCVGPCGSNVNSLVTTAAVSFTFADYCPGSGPCSFLSPLYAATDTNTGRNSFSVQLNSDYFNVTCHSNQGNCTPGDIGVVQFSYQADTGWLDLFGSSALCVWNNASTPNPTMPATWRYSSWCAGVPSIYGADVPWTTGTGQIPLQITGGAANQSLWVMACLPWVSGAPGKCWSAVAPDVLGLCWDPASGQCSWQNASGSILGYGGGSTVQFPTGVTMFTSVVATACNPPASYVPPFHPFPPPGIEFMPSALSPLQCPAPSGFNNSNGGPVGTAVTVEMNNLTPAVSSPSSLVQACDEGTCWITYSASD
jgi:hypothetical protein